MPAYDFDDCSTDGSVDVYDILPEGGYHFLVESVEDPAEGQNGDEIDAFRVTFAVLAGPCEGRKITITFWNPTEDGQYNKKSIGLQKALAIAASMAKPGQTGVSLEWADLENRSVKMRIKHRTAKNGNTYAEIATVQGCAAIYHPRDPRAADIQGDSEYVEITPSPEFLKHVSVNEDVAESSTKKPAPKLPSKTPSKTPAKSHVKSAASSSTAKSAGAYAALDDDEDVA